MSYKKLKLLNTTWRPRSKFYWIQTLLALLWEDGVESLTVFSTMSLLSLSKLKWGNNMRLKSKVNTKFWWCTEQRLYEQRCLTSSKTNVCWKGTLRLIKWKIDFAQITCFDVCFVNTSKGNNSNLCCWWRSI